MALLYSGTSFDHGIIRLLHATKESGLWSAASKLDQPMSKTGFWHEAIQLTKQWASDWFLMQHFPNWTHWNSLHNEPANRKHMKDRIMERKTNAFILVRFCMMKPYLDSMRWAGAASRDETLAWLNEVMVLEVIWLNRVRSGFWNENYPTRLNNERGTGFWHEAFQSGLIAKKKPS